MSRWVILRQHRWILINIWKQAKQTIAISLRKMNSNVVLFRLELYSPLCIYMWSDNLFTQQALPEWILYILAPKEKSDLNSHLIVKLLCARQSVYPPSFNRTTNQEVDIFGSIHQTKAVSLVKIKWLLSSKSGKSIQLWC